MRLRHLALPCLISLLSLIACDGNQPVAPALEARATAAGGPTVKAPSNTNASDASDTRIDISWQDNSTNESGFEVWRSASGPGGPFTKVAVTGANVTSYNDAGLTPSTQYCYNVRAIRAYDGRTSVSSFSGTACATTLAPPPPPPPPPAAGGLMADPRSSTAVELFWVDNSAVETGFRVERSLDRGATWTPVATTAADATTFWDDGRTAEQEVCYRVVGVYADGESPPSHVACTVPLAAPSDLVASALDPQTIELRWTDNSSLEDGFQVWRNPGGWWDAVATLPANSTSYRDLVISNTLYSYYVTAYKDVGRSTGSNIVQAFAPTNPPSTPPAAPLMGTAYVYPFQIGVSWWDNSDNEFGFKVERCQKTDCGDADFTVIGIVGTRTSETHVNEYDFSDGNIEPGRTYTYRVRAFNSAGDSPPSSQLSATACVVAIWEDGTYYCT